MAKCAEPSSTIYENLVPSELDLRREERSLLEKLCLKKRKQDLRRYLEWGLSSLEIVEEMGIKGANSFLSGRKKVEVGRKSRRSNSVGICSRSSDSVRTSCFLE